MSKAIQFKRNGENIYPCPYYPVGSIFLSVNSTNPGTIFGGTWEQIKGRFLLGTGANDANSTDYWGGMSAGQYDAPAGQKGGECRHQLSIGEMPNHSHNYNSGRWYYAERDGGGDVITNQSGTSYMFTRTTSSSGGNQAHNNMPPYLSVYMWKRVS
jgi:hypothetical protein